MFYLCDAWFLPEDGDTTPSYVADVGDALRLRFYIDQCYSPVAWQLQDLHQRVLPG